MSRVILNEHDVRVLSRVNIFPQSREATSALLNSDITSSDLLNTYQYSTFFQEHPSHEALNNQRKDNPYIPALLCRFSRCRPSCRRWWRRRGSQRSRKQDRKVLPSQFPHSLILQLTISSRLSSTSQNLHQHNPNPQRKSNSSFSTT